MSATYTAHSSFHRHRIQVIARWPESAYKRTALHAAEAALTTELAFERAARATREKE
ncbi:MAG: hypothetical protein LAP87_21240 [Acidobacteriia bacterium]|nr:hypothetical protein [Terriglobia bacterium]